jgi:acetylornithine deacetylase/succinyl-diaminopimelate desuccinylase-like protein
MNHVLARVLVKAIRESGLKPSYIRKTGSSDMNITVPMGIPTIAYGPGDPGLDHMDDESILIDDYRKSIGIIKQALLELKV